MQVAILAGGLATRLGPLAKETPKSLIRIGGRPFLDYQLEFLERGGIKEVVLCVGHLGEQIEKHFGDGARFGVSIEYSYDGNRLLGTAGALRNAESLLEDEFFIMYGDSYLFLDFAAILSYFRDLPKLGLMVVYRNCDQFERSNVAIDGDFVSEYRKDSRNGNKVYVDYGASLLRKAALRLIPPGQPYSLEQFFGQLVGQRELLAYETTQRFFEIGSADGLSEFRQYVASRRMVQ